MFVSVKFHEEATRTYTYTYDGGDALSPGDKVYVQTPKDGQKVVIVDSVDVPEPPFACKPIIGAIEEGDEAPS